MTTFNFYLLNLSFRAPEGLKLESLRSSIEQLSSDCEFIREHQERIFRHPSIYDEVLWGEYLVLDVLYNPEISEKIGRDHHYMLQVIIDHSSETALKNEDVTGLLENHTPDLVNGLLCLHQVKEVALGYCIYNRNDWFDFHRYFLGVYPISEDHFANRCPIYFPQLHFHEDISNTLSTLDGGLSQFSHSIIHCLANLNDKFRDHYIKNNIPESLRRFSSECGIETTNEGDAQRRNNLSFSFINDNNMEELVYCEPHMKISRSNNPGDHRYYHNRIYFHPGKSHIAGGKILIGHIGRHL